MRGVTSLVLLMLMLASCDTQTPSGEMRGQINQIGIRYTKDPRTGICFAYTSELKQGFAAVECTNAVMGAVIDDRS